MDTERIRQLADSAEERAIRCHNKYLDARDKADELESSYTHLASQSAIEAEGYLNDYFYWIGHANAYKGIVAGLEIQAVIEDEMDAEGSCP